MEKEKDKKKCLSDQPGFKAGRPPYINIWLPQPNGYSGDHPVLYLATASINKSVGVLNSGDVLAFFTPY